MKSLTLLTGNRDLWQKLQHRVEMPLVFSDEIINTHDEAYSFILGLFLNRDSLKGKNCHLYSPSHVPFDFMWALKIIKEAGLSRAQQHDAVRRLFKKETLTNQECGQVLRTKMVAKAWNGKRWVDISKLDPGHKDEFQSTWGGLLEVASHAGAVVSRVVNQVPVRKKS